MDEFELEHGERVTRVVRKHPLVLIGYAIPFAVLAYLPVLLLSYMASGVIPAKESIVAALSFDNKWVRFIVGAWWLFLWMFFFSRLTRYFLNQWVITTTRIVDIAQFGFFRREVSSVLLIHIQDVSTNVTGLFHTLFNFGTLEVQSAGADEKFVMDGLSDPRGVRDLIMGEIADLHLDGSEKK